MTEIINFATAAELIEMIEAGNATVSGMSAAEAAAALGAVESGKMLSFNVIKGGAGEIIELTNSTASEAFAAYEAAGGSISAAGAATEGASAAANLTEIITAPGTASEAVATGGILTMSLPTWAAAAAPLLGVAFGVGLYELAPDFWTKVSQTLLPFAWDDTEVMPAVVDANGQVYLEGAAVEALKQLFIEEGVGEAQSATLPDESVLYYPGIYPPIPVASAYKFLYGDPSYEVVIASGSAISFIYDPEFPTQVMWASLEPFTADVRLLRPDGTLITHTLFPSTESSFKDGTKYYRFNSMLGSAYLNMPEPWDFVVAGQYSDNAVITDVATIVLRGNISSDGYPEGTSKWEGNEVPDPSQGGIEIVTKPDGTSETYYPAQLPIDVPAGTSNNPEYNPNPTAPTPGPAISPHINPTPQPNQYPEEVPLPETGKGTAPLPNPVTVPEPTFDPDADPSAEPAPEPAPEPPQPPVPQPGGVTPSPLLPQSIPSIVPTTDASGLIHVYNPTPSEMISFGRWLWVTYADTTIDKIWNNPFDGILGAFELYATPSTGAKENIRSGFLVSDTQAAIVPTRYISINCGSIVIPEELANYLDYSPYSKAYAYLPFIGIVELDVDDIVGHGINIMYHIDTYNGSCIAQITVAKADYSNTVYQFSGNCAVDVPLSGGSQAAIKAGMIGAAATGIASVIGGVATGLSGNIPGAVGGIAYGLGGAVAHAVSQKSSVQHSGTFGASYGAMGIKTPYIIIKRPVQVGVVNYNVDYGFPAHKRVIIGNCSGFLRVREVNVISPNATDDEKKRIEELLKEGVYIG